MTFAKNSQSWGGRRKLNPHYAPNITCNDVLKVAKQINVEVKREGKGMWWVKTINGNWVTLGQTNYIAWDNLQNREWHKIIVKLEKRSLLNGN